mmetsp:Transcript_2500/g.5749  ORF Transcript_2500/g.5749 Transcript_2500/m.5749 type:complete len:183 (+) Transcript_2500:51-599(+)
MRNMFDVDEDSDEDEQQFPSSALKHKPRTLSRGRLFSIACRNLLKLLKLFTAISLSVMMIFESDCGTLMLPMLAIVSFVMYCDVVLFAMVPITFKFCNQTCARNFYRVYKVLKWILRITFVILAILYNIFVLSPFNECRLGQSTPGILLVATLVAVDICLLMYCSFVSVIACGIIMTLTASR